MKATLEDRLLTAAKNTKAVAENSFKRPISSLLSLCMLAGIAATNLSYSQREETEMSKDWDKQPTYGGYFLSEKEIPAHYKHIWFDIVLLGLNLEQSSIAFHAIHDETNPPYAVVLISKRPSPIIKAIPKEMFKKGAWEGAKKAKLNAFATKWKFEMPSSPTMRLPINRTLTSNDGKSIDGIVLSRSESALVYQRKADNKKVTIPFDKLSEDDKKWMQQTSNPRPRLLAITDRNWKSSPHVIQACMDAKYDIVFPPEKDGKSDLTNMTPEEIQSFDIIWRWLPEHPLPSEKQRDQFKGVILTPGDWNNKSQTSKLEKGIIVDDRTVIHRAYAEPEEIKESIAAAIKLASAK
jgi:hypothetical protein